MFKILHTISNKSFLMIVLVVSLLIGVLVRLPYLVSDDLFPLGDGGLFVEMINSIKANHYALPEYIIYNHVQIPFAYPPLGFYLAIIVSRIFELPTLLVVRYLPIILNLLTIIVFVLLSSEILKDRPTIIVGSMIFPVILQVYLWTIKGGGISRSPGFLFTILTLYLICLFNRERHIYYLVAGLFSLGATILSHPEWALVALSSVPIFLLIRNQGSRRRRVQLLLNLYVGAAVLTSPWWGTILFRFGLSPLIMAGQVAKMDLSEILENFLSGRMLSVRVTLFQDFFIPFLALAGIVISLYRKEFFLIIWLTVVYVVAPKNSPIPGLIPLTLLSAIGLRSFDNLVPSMHQFIKTRQSMPAQLFDTVMRPFSLFSVSSVYLFIVIPVSLISLIEQPILHPIKRSDRAAMQFIANNTPQNAKFVVLTPFDWFEADSVEWFPLLAERRSLTTPQGLEWVSSYEFLKIGQSTYQLSSLVRLAQAGNESGEIVKYVETYFEEFDYVAIFANNLDENFGGFLETKRFDLVYSKNNVVLFLRTSMEKIK
jgi:hypothetical protein